MSTLGALGSAFVSGQRASLEQKGDQLLFYVKALAWTPRAIRRYPREIVNTLAEVTFGAGADFWMQWWIDGAPVHEA